MNIGEEQDPIELPLPVMPDEVPQHEEQPAPAPVVELVPAGS